MPKASPIQDACWPIMEDAYNEASANGTLPADARQFAYAVRRLSGLGDKLDMKYVTDSPAGGCLLDRFIHDHPVLTASWDIVRRPRGEFMAPNGDEVRLGTIAVRDHVSEIEDTQRVVGLPLRMNMGLPYPDLGPNDDYGQLLYIEKAGFNPAIRADGLLRRHDVGVLSSQGFSVDAARDLMAYLVDQHDRHVMIAHDFDYAGIGIAASIMEAIPSAVDLGLTWDFVQSLSDLHLRSEAVTYKFDPRQRLDDLDVEQDAIDYLCSGKQGDVWVGRHVELNALTLQEFLDWLNERIEDEGVGKVVPEIDVLEAAYRRQWAEAGLNDEIRKVWKATRREADWLDLFDTDLFSTVTDALDEDTDQTWRDVIEATVKAARAEIRTPAQVDADVLADAADDD